MVDAPYGSCVDVDVRGIMRNAGLEETQAGIKIAGRNINNLRYADDTTLMAESEEELKSHAQHHSLSEKCKSKPL